MFQTTDVKSVRRRVVVSDGVGLEVADAGEGPPILLLHGFPDSLAMWDGVTERLVVAGHRVIAYDQRGFGASSAPVGRRHYALDRIVEDVTEVLAALGVREPVTLVGHDWGALVGWALCLSRPELVARHVAISAGHPRAVLAAAPSQWRRSYYVPAFLLTGVAERVFSLRDFAAWRRMAVTHPRVDGLVADTTRPGRMTAALNWYRRNAVAIVMRRWGVCRVPTLGVLGSEDPYFAEPGMARSGAYVDASWKYVRVDGAGHWLPIEQPERVAALIAGWASMQGGCKAAVSTSGDGPSMTATTSKSVAGALVAGLALAVSACGDSADNAGSAAADSKPKAAAAANIDLAPMLMRAGEEPGFRPGALAGAMPAERATFTGVDAFASEMGMPPEDIRRLRSEGFLSFTVGPIRGPRGTAGLTNASLYETAEGARRSMAHDLRPDVIRSGGPIEGLRFFTVRGVPGARGWAASEPPVANVLWVQGRCYMTLGNQGPGRLESRLSKGVRAIYQRTQGRCG